MMGHTAILVIDMLNDFVLEGAPLEVPAAREIISHIKVNLEKAREKNIPVIYYFCSTAMFIVALVMTSFKSYRQFLEGTELENV